MRLFSYRDRPVHLGPYPLERLRRTDAQHRARLTYAAYVGFLQLSLQLQQTRLQQEEFEAYVEHMMATLIPSV